MEIRYRPTAEDVIRAMRATTQPPWAMFLFVVFLALMFLVGIYLVHHDLGTIGWAWLALSVALGIAVYEVPQLQARRAISKNPSARSDIVLNISDAGIDGVAATGNTQLPTPVEGLHEIQGNRARLFAGFRLWAPLVHPQTGYVSGADSRVARTAPHLSWQPNGIDLKSS